jgi:hypothetical protein
LKYPVFGGSFTSFRSLLISGGAIPDDNVCD